MIKIEKRRAKSLPGDSFFSKSFNLTKDFLVFLEKLANKRRKKKMKMMMDSSRLYGLPKISFKKLFIKALKLLLIIKVTKIIAQPIAEKQIFCYNLKIIKFKIKK